MVGTTVLKLPYDKGIPNCVYCNKPMTYVEYRAGVCMQSPTRLHETEPIVEVPMQS